MQSKLGNMDPHVHTPQVVHEEFGPMWGRRSTIWWVVYGDQKAVLSTRDNPYDWPAAKLEKKLARALKTAVEAHDKETEKAKHRVEGERSAMRMLEDWASRLQKDLWASEQ